MKRIGYSELYSWVSRVLQEAGVEERDANICSDVLVDADARSISTHGIALLRGNIESVKSGVISLNSSWRVVRENAFVSRLDCEGGFGFVGGVIGIRNCLKTVEKHGVGLIGIQNFKHWGRPGYYARLGAEAGYITLCFNNTRSVMPMSGYKTANIGNNPIAFAFPNREYPIVFDFSPSITTVREVLLTKKTGGELKPNLALDRNGSETLDPCAVLEGGALLPIGDYIGANLALVIELLVGLVCSGEPGNRMNDSTLDAVSSSAAGGVILVIDPSTFGGASSFQVYVDRLLGEVREADKIEGKEAFIPGSRSHLFYEESLEKGIILGDDVYNDMMDEFGSFSELKVIETVAGSDTN